MKRTTPPSPHDASLEFDLETQSQRRSGTAPRCTMDLADRRASAGRLGARDRERAAAVARARGVRLEDAILDLGLMKEADLLREIATHHRTRFVSTAQLDKLSVAP